MTEVAGDFFSGFVLEHGSFGILYLLFSVKEVSRIVPAQLLVEATTVSRQIILGLQTERNEVCLLLLLLFHLKLGLGFNHGRFG